MGLHRGQNVITKNLQRPINAPSFIFKNADWQKAEMPHNKHGKLMMSGRFGTVFKVTRPGSKTWAARVHTTRSEDRQNGTIKISKYADPVGADSDDTF